MDNKSPELSLAFISNMQSEMMSQIAKLKSLINDAASAEVGQGEIVCRDDAENWCKLLSDEAEKVSGLELSFALVGTMKAGKSTVINAIVGTELLPSRATAMTVLPTIITHKEGETDPILSFSHADPFNEAIRALRDFKQEKPKQLDSELLKTFSDIRLGEFESIKIKSEYRGTSEIYKFLVTLNDIARICEVLKIKNPIEDYIKREQFPRISVEFGYLKGRENQNLGRLSLVDTPGINEAGQGHLKVLVQAELKRASAVISVLDYTQLNSKADKELREEVIEHQNMAMTKLFVLVNKIDAYTEGRDMDPKTVEEHVRTHLFPDRSIDGIKLSVKSKVFPIAAKKALYSQLASLAIERTNALPRPTDEPWVTTYAPMAFGDDWEGEIQKQDAVYQKGKCQCVRRKSGFDAPLEEIIYFSLVNAIPHCLLSAIARMRRILKRFEPQLTLQRNAFKSSVVELEKAIGRLDAQLGRIQTVEEDLLASKKKALESVAKQLQEALEKLKDDIQEDVEALAKEAGETERTKDEQRQGKRRQYIPRFLSRLFPSTHDSKENFKKALTGREPIKFTSKNDAQAFVTALNQRVGNGATVELKQEVRKLELTVNQHQENLKMEVQRKVQPIIDNMRDDMKHEFQLDVSFPIPEFAKIELDLDVLSHELVSEHSMTVPEIRHVRRWYTLWLYEHEVICEKSIKLYTVDPEKLRKNICTNLQQAVKFIEANVQTYIEGKFKTRLERFFSELREEIKPLREGVNKSAELQKCDQNIQEETLLRIDRYKVGLANLTCQIDDAAKNIGEGFSDV